MRKTEKLENTKEFTVQNKKKPNQTKNQIRFRLIYI